MQSTTQIIFRIFLKIKNWQHFNKYYKVVKKNFKILIKKYINFLYIIS
jgi:hypothetical protein